jgi:hypothetical protein
MNKDKQIEEMAKDLDTCPYIAASIGCDKHEGSVQIAEYLTAKGYRLASDVAREIFAEIDREICLALESNYKARDRRQMIVIAHGSSTLDREFIEYVSGKIDTLRGINDFIAELKKKYESENE